MILFLPYKAVLLDLGADANNFFFRKILMFGVIELNLQIKQFFGKSGNNQIRGKGVER